ncbi:uncharacterized, partial [Tachysurus ichikawai]
LISLSRHNIQVVFPFKSTFSPDTGVHFSNKNKQVHRKQVTDLSDVVYPPSNPFIPPSSGQTSFRMILVVCTCSTILLDRCGKISHRATTHKHKRHGL